MRLEPGTRIGPYEIVSLLGEGGMGEVYRALDPRLKREVAIKRLPDAVAADPERLARFEREAKLLASLSHPAIATLHGLEESGGARALVMELVEGPTLAERLREAPLPPAEALPIFLQIAEALEFAHERGVIHRDLKPANIKLTPEGKVKVLDFGLAKALAVEPPPGAPTASPTTQAPTVTSAGSQAGTILGTAGYMSPEQARGKPADRRADIWAFGAVMYESLTGMRPFAGETISETLAAVMRDDADLGKLPHATPPGLREIVARCLVKEPRRRLQSIGDARVRIEEILAGREPLAGVAMPAAERRSPLPRVVPWIIAALALVLAAWQGMPQGEGAPPDASRHARRLAITGLSVTPSSSAAISPDGREIVAYDPTPGAPGLFRRSLDAFEFRLIPGSSGSYNPFFSPDGASLGVFKDKQVCVLPGQGGSARCLAEVEGFATGDWGAGGTIVFATQSSDPEAYSGLMRISSTGGTPERVTRVARDKGEQAHVYPQILPGGEHILFTVARSSFAGDLAVAPLSGGEPRVVLENAMRGRYLASGHLAYVDPSTAILRAIPFDRERLAPLGPSSEVARDIAMTSDNIPSFAVSNSGTLIYSLSGQFEESFTVVRVDRNGLATPLLDETGPWAQPRLSPDGRSLLLRRSAQPDCHLWLWDFARRSLSRLTSKGDHHSPVWREDGGILFGLAEGSGPRQVFALGPDGVLSENPVIAVDFPVLLGSATRDGRFFAITRDDRAERNDIFVHDTRDGTTAPFLASEHDEDFPAFSPDGRWLAYTSNETGRDEVYVRPHPGPGPKYPISTAGGTGALWSRDGRLLYYAERTRMMRVEVAGGPRFTAGAPEIVFENDIFVWERVRNYDLMPDDGSFVMIRRSGPQSRALLVVLDWFAELERLAPVPAR